MDLRVRKEDPARGSGQSEGNLRLPPGGKEPWGV